MAIGVLGDGKPLGFEAIEGKLAELGQVLGSKQEEVGLRVLGVERTVKETGEGQVGGESGNEIDV